MCYDRRRAEACVDESARHALANAGGREIVGKKNSELGSVTFKINNQQRLPVNLKVE